MRLLSNEDILKNNVDTIPQFYILDYLKKNLNIGKFDVYIVDRNNLKVIDKEDKHLYFNYDETTKEISYFEDLKEKDFYYEFKDAIIKSRKNGNIQVIFNEVGKNNFDNLNSLFAIYNEHFGGMKFYNLVSSLNSNQETEQTKIYYDLVKQRDEILKNMRCYSSMRNKNVNSI